MFMTQQFINVVLIYGVPSAVDCSFEDGVFCTVFVNKHIVTNKLNKQLIKLRSKFMDR